MGYWYRGRYLREPGDRPASHGARPRHLHLEDYVIGSLGYYPVAVGVVIQRVGESWGRVHRRTMHRYLNRMVARGDVGVTTIIHPTGYGTARGYHVPR